jgi:hypothetical protein
LLDFPEISLREVIAMSNKEIAKNIIDSLPDYKIEYVVMFLKNIQSNNEIDDDMFCQKMYEDYLNDPDPEKDKAVSIEDFAKELGIKLK